MQIVSFGDNLHEMSKSIIWKKEEKKNKNMINLLSAEYALRVITMQQIYS